MHNGRRRPRSNSSPTTVATSSDSDGTSCCKRSRSRQHRRAVALAPQPTEAPAERNGNNAPRAMASLPSDSEESSSDDDVLDHRERRFEHHVVVTSPSPLCGSMPFKDCCAVKTCPVCLRHNVAMHHDLHAPATRAAQQRRVWARPLQCRHEFHQRCLWKWFENANLSCPVCRTPSPLYD